MLLDIRSITCFVTESLSDVRRAALGYESNSLDSFCYGSKWSVGIAHPTFLQQLLSSHKPNLKNITVPTWTEFLQSPTPVNLCLGRFGLAHPIDNIARIDV